MPFASDTQSPRTILGLEQIPPTTIYMNSQAVLFANISEVEALGRLTQVALLESTEMLYAALPL